MGIDDTFNDRREEELEVDCEDAFMQDLLELCQEYAEDLPVSYMTAGLDTVKLSLQLSFLIET